MLHETYHDPYPFRMQLTLEGHFRNLAHAYPEIEQLYSLWLLLKRDLIERLQNTRSIFVHFSLHDSRHSEAVISSIEMFLGEDRIKELSASDTFMLLCCAYSHDYGMALTVDNIYDILMDGKGEFRAFLRRIGENDRDGTTRRAAALLLDLYQSTSLREGHEPVKIYQAIILLVEQYIRPLHGIGVKDIAEDFHTLFDHRVKARIQKNIIEICQAHTRNVSALLELEIYAQGLFSDLYHPRMIAAMIRLGDALDLDNGRFPKSFTDSLLRGGTNIPEISQLHHEKHESITHYYVGPKKIDIAAKCSGKNAHKVAHLLADWLHDLDADCAFLVQHWAEISQPDFGPPPRLNRRDIFIDGKPYSSTNENLHVQMPQDKLLSLLKGSNIYDDRYVGIREVLQNAVDASLLQLWYDLCSNRYVNLMDGARPAKSCRPVTPLDIPPELYAFYDIHVEVIKNLPENCVYIIVKDRGIGLDENDVSYMVNIGASKADNPFLQQILKNMPAWMKPAGIFGIGLQSVFQLTDKIMFFSRRPNKPEKYIHFYSYEKNYGRIEMGDMEPESDAPFYDNCVQGTNVKFAVRPFEKEQDYSYYDLEFDPDDRLNALYAEIVRVVRREIRNTDQNYFNIDFTEIVDDGYRLEKSRTARLAYSFFGASQKKGRNSPFFPYSFAPLFASKSCGPIAVRKNLLSYWSQEDQVFYQIKISPCVPGKENPRFNGIVHFLELPPFKPTERFLNVLYKFYRLTNIDTLYEPLYTNLTRYNSLNTSLFEMSILILDAPADRYLNIDRQRLRDHALDFSRVEAAQAKMLSAYCHDLVGSFLQEPRMKASPLRLIANNLQKDPALVATLFLLFIKYAEMDDFNAFVHCFRETISDTCLYVADLDELSAFKRFADQKLLDSLSSSLGPTDGAHLMLESLLPGPRQKTMLDYTNSFPLWLRGATDGRLFPDAVNELGPDGAQKAPAASASLKSVLDDYPSVSFLEKQLPVSCLVPREIRMASVPARDGGLPPERKALLYPLYQVSVCRTPESTPPIRMDSYSTTADYLYALYDVNPKGELYVNFSTVIHKVFKPNVQFSTLLVGKRPKSFLLGLNFTNYLESNIGLFILSPFDTATTAMLDARSKKNWELLLQESGHETFFCGDIVEEVMQSDTLRKCVRYVRRHHYHIPRHKPAPSEEEIQAAYRHFAEDFCMRVLLNLNLLPPPNIPI